MWDSYVKDAEVRLRYAKQAFKEENITYRSDLLRKL